MAAMAAISVAQRSFRCCLWRTTGFSPSLESNKASILKRFRHSPISSRFRRESYFLNSMLPIHTAIASTRLVSKLPSESNMSAEGTTGSMINSLCFERNGREVLNLICINRRFAKVALICKIPAIHQVDLLITSAPSSHGKVFVPPTSSFSPLKRSAMRFVSHQAQNYSHNHESILEIGN